MLKLLLRRLAVLPVMLLGVTLLTFTISHLIPADPARVAAGLNAPEEQVQRLREEMGLTRPLPTQYLLYLSGLLQGDWGKSALNQKPVVADILQSLPATLEMLVLSTLGFIILGVPFGIFMGISRSKAAGMLLSVVSYTSMAFPVFWLGLTFQVIFYRWLDWFPAAGRIAQNVTPPATLTGFYTVDSLLTGNWAALGSSLEHLVLPVACLALARFAVTARFIALGMREALSTDYVRTAHAKGLSRTRVILKHALRNVLIPVTTMTGLQFGWMLGGSVLIESVFTWPGIGWYAWRSIVALDFQPIMGITLVFSFAFILINLITDLLYELLDPRIVVH